MNLRNKITYSGRESGATAKVFYTGTSALVKGQALCYDADRGTAASVDVSRHGTVELPSQSNNMNFAGVTTRAYPAQSNGQDVEIWLPGSICEVATVSPTTVNSTRLNCLALGSGVAGTSGRWLIGGGMAGRGSAIALQTIATSSSTTDSPVVLGSNIDGTATVAADGVTITHSGAFTAAAVGDKILVVGGATSADATAQVTRGVYTISSVTSANVVVVSSAMCSAASDIAYYWVRSTPTCLAYLEDGTESGCVEFISPYTDGSGTTVVDAMVGGRTLICGGYTVGTGNAIHTLANGTYIGQHKSFKLLGALTTSDYVVTLATTGEQLDGTTDLATLTIDGQNDESLLMWCGPYWKLVANVGTALG